MHLWASFAVLLTIAAFYLFLSVYIVVHILGSYYLRGRRRKLG